MKKFLFLTRREWLVALAICAVTVAGADQRFAYSKPVCVLAEEPWALINPLREDLAKGRQVSDEDLDRRWQQCELNSVYKMSVSGDQHTISFTPKSYEIGRYVHTQRFAYIFDTKSLQTKVYDRNGICFYTQP